MMISLLMTAGNILAQTSLAGEAGTRPIPQSILKGMQTVQNRASAEAKNYKMSYISRKAGEDGVATIILNVVGDPCRRIS